MTTVAASRADPATLARLAHAIAWLAERWDRQPALDDAARAAGLSPAHFQKLFTAHAGVSPKSFVRALALGRARAALTSGASVLEAALEAGLSGPGRLHDLTVRFEAMTPGEIAARGAGRDLSWGMAASPFGMAVAGLGPRGIVALGFVENDLETARADIHGRFPRAHWTRDDDAVAAALDPLFGRRRPGAQIAPAGPPFDVRVWRALLAIPEGGVTTYGAIAAAIGAPGAARAVGSAVGRNPVSWAIPCHRVLRATGALGGYHWGLARKRAMLALEAARTAPHEPA